jgi:uncharacterized membrane protein YagU involved in acid resistance
MLRDRLLLGVWIGMVAAAATAGALVGFGAARGSPLLPLNTVAHIVLGSRAFYVTDAHLLVTTLGVLVHVASVVVWGILFAIVLARAEGVRLWLGALVFTAAIAAIDFLLLPKRFSPGFEESLTRVEVVVVYAVLAASLVLARRTVAPRAV